MRARRSYQKKKRTSSKNKTDTTEGEGHHRPLTDLSDIERRDQPISLAPNGTEGPKLVAAQADGTETNPTPAMDLDLDQSSPTVDTKATGSKWTIAAGKRPRVTPLSPPLMKALPQFSLVAWLMPLEKVTS